MVFPGKRAVIFVDGCFWHGHDCALFKWPSTRIEFWRRKIERNRAKDAEARAALEGAGWRGLVIWECALKGRTRRPTSAVIDQAVRWLQSSRSWSDISGDGNADCGS